LGKNYSCFTNLPAERKKLFFRQAGRKRGFGENQVKGTTADVGGSTAKLKGNTANDGGSTTKVEGSTVDDRGTTAKPKGNTAKGEGSTAKLGFC